MIASIPSPKTGEFHLGPLLVHAYGLLYGVAVEGRSAPAEAELRAIGAAHDAEFIAAPATDSRFAAPEAEYRRTGAWRVCAPEQAQVADRLAAIARAVYGCGLR